MCSTGGLGAPICQVQDGTCRTKFSDQSTTMTNEPRARVNHSRRRASSCSFASCKFRRPSCKQLDPTDGDEHDPHNRCVVKGFNSASVQIQWLVAHAGARKQHRHERAVEAKHLRSFTLPAVVLSGLVAGLFAWRRRKRHRCISAHNEVSSDKQAYPTYFSMMSFLIIVPAYTFLT